MAAPRLILASASPQRRAILEQVGIPFEARVSGAPELEEGPPVEVALENAYRKATAVARDAGSAARLPVLGVDTVVSLGPRILGKPADPAQAAAMLSALQGRRHVVVSGLCLIDPDRTRTAAARTRTAAARTIVEFRPLDPAGVQAYVDTGEWCDRAGGYAIQRRGATLVTRIEGDYLNVVGLPVATLIDLAPDLLRD